MIYTLPKNKISVSLLANKIIGGKGYGKKVKFKLEYI